LGHTGISRNAATNRKRSGPYCTATRGVPERSASGDLRTCLVAFPRCDAAAGRPGGHGQFSCLGRSCITSGQATNHLGSSLAELVWSLATDTGNKGNTGKGNTTARPLHSTLPRFGARIRAEADVATQSHCGVWNCTSQHLALPRTVKVKVTRLLSGHHRDGDGQFQCNFFHKVESGPQWRSPAMPHRSPAMATAYSPLLSPARESEGGAAAMWEHGAATRHTVKVRVECSTKRQAKSTRP